MAALWWIWISAGVALGIVEIFVPGFFFLGFAGGAIVTGLILLAGGPFAAWLTSSVPYALVFFALISLVLWLGMRRVAGVRKGQLKIWDRDINEN